MSLGEAAFFGIRLFLERDLDVSITLTAPGEKTASVLKGESEQLTTVAITTIYL